ncbi:MAG: Helix-turn-helix domain, partial [Candidatus Binatota bacterium]|nr:Helix-turn-helix domain [Candidatus Binatota bacterium]
MARMSPDRSRKARASATKPPHVGRLCQRLQSARKAAGKSAETASRDSGVAMRYLKMFEEGEYPLVADTAYLAPYVRKYASYLGLDGEEAVREFLLETEPQAEPYVASPSAPPKSNAAKQAASKAARARAYSPVRPFLNPWVVYTTLALVGVGAIYGAATINRRKSSTSESVAEGVPPEAAPPVDIARADKPSDVPAVPA